MKVLMGQVPNLSWWRLNQMTKDEIESFNRKHLVEVEMKDDSLSDTQQLRNVGKCYIAAYDKVIDLVDHNNKIFVDKESWNAAIEAAADWIYKYEEQLLNNFEKTKDIQASLEIRKLKK